MFCCNFTKFCKKVAAELLPRPFPERSPPVRLWGDTSGKRRGCCPFTHDGERRRRGASSPWRRGARCRRGRCRSCP